MKLLAHHERRLTELKKAIDVYPGANAYELAGHLSWSMRGLSWDQFPPGQKWFAVGETMAHLDHLAKNYKNVKSGEFTHFLTKQPMKKLKQNYVKVRFLAINSLHKTAEIIDQKINKNKS